MSLTNLTKAYRQDFSNATSVVVLHNLGTDTPVVDVYDLSDTRIMPATVVADNANQLTITFSGSTSGRVYVV